MLSVIFVPIICTFLLVALYFLLSPRRRQDAPAAAQFQLKNALNFIQTKQDKYSKKDFKKLDILVNKARSFIERAKFEDVYDMTVPLNDINSARDITQSLLLVMPSEPLQFLEPLSAMLNSAIDYIHANCGITDASAHKMNLNSFSRKTKEDKAKAHLESIKKK